MTHIGEKIKSLRKQQNMSRAKLAEKSGVSEVSIRKYEDGDRNPKIETLNKIANSLNISIDTLIDDQYFERITSFKNLIKENEDAEKDLKLLASIIGEYINSSFFFKLMSIDLNKSNEDKISLTKLNGFTESEFLSLIKVLNSELLKIIENRKINPLYNQKLLVTFTDENT